MTRVFTDQVVSGIHDRDSGRILEDIEFVGCTFRDCTLSMASAPDKSTHVRRAFLKNCRAEHCLVMNPVLHQVTVDTLATGRTPLFTWGALFDEVTITGQVDSIVVTPHPDSPLFPAADRVAFSNSREEFYSQIEWALDIRGAQAKELEVYGVPSHLIRRDPATQAVVRREHALDERRWRQLDLAGTWWKAAINKLLLHGYDEVVLAVPLRHPRAALFAAGLELLRSVGIADPG